MMRSTAVKPRATAKQRRRCSARIALAARVHGCEGAVRVLRCACILSNTVNCSQARVKPGQTRATADQCSAHVALAARVHGWEGAVRVLLVVCLVVARGIDGGQFGGDGGDLGTPLIPLEGLPLRLKILAYVLECGLEGLRIKLK